MGRVLPLAWTGSEQRGVKTPPQRDVVSQFGQHGWRRERAEFVSTTAVPKPRAKTINVNMPALHPGQRQVVAAQNRFNVVAVADAGAKRCSVSTPRTPGVAGLPVRLVRAGVNIAGPKYGAKSRARWSPQLHTG